MSIRTLKKLAKHASKHCVGMEGNVSAKVNKNQLYIKASGTRLETLEDDDLVAFDFDGNQLSNLEKKGSMELSFHTFLLGFDNIKFVSHTHPINTLKILCSDNSWLFAENRLFPDQVIFNGAKSCLVPYGKPGKELTELIKSYVHAFIAEEGYFPKIILLQNHGVIACGNTVDECIISTDICEKSAEIFNGIKKNEIVFLSKQEMIDLISDDNEKYRQNQLK